MAPGMMVSCCAVLALFKALPCKGRCKTLHTITKHLVRTCSCMQCVVWFDLMTVQVVNSSPRCCGRSQRLACLPKLCQQLHIMSTLLCMPNIWQQQHVQQNLSGAMMSCQGPAGISLCSCTRYKISDAWDNNTTALCTSFRKANQSLLCTVVYLP